MLTPTDKLASSSQVVSVVGVLGKSYKIKIASKSVAEAELNILSDATSLLVHDREFAIESQIIDGKDEVIIYRSTIFQIESSNIRTCFTIIIVTYYYAISSM